LIDHAAAAGLEPPPPVAEEDSDEGEAGSDDGGVSEQVDVDDLASMSGTSATDCSGFEEARVPDRTGRATGPSVPSAFTSAHGGDVLLMTAGALRDKSPEYQMGQAPDGDESSDSLNAHVARDESSKFAMPQAAHMDARNTAYDESAPQHS